MALFLEKPRYYDAPDGEKPVDKIVSLAKRGLIGGLLVGAGDCLYFTDTKNALQTFNCLAYWVVPMVGLGATFASVTYVATRIRKKDDAKNYAIGAASCAPILHAWTKSPKASLWGTVALIAFAVSFKHKEVAGRKYFLQPKHIYGHYMYDMSVMKDVDKDWRPQYRHSTW